MSGVVVIHCAICIYLSVHAQDIELSTVIISCNESINISKPAAPLIAQTKTVETELCLSCVSLCRECSRLFGEEGMTLKLFLKRTAPFSILWTLTNYLYLLALRKLTATDVSALYCCHKAFVFLLSWIVLKDRFMGVRVCTINVSNVSLTYTI